MEAFAPALAAIVAGLITYQATKRRNDASAAESVANAAATLIAPMQEQISALRERLATFEADNQRLRDRVVALEEQVRSLGHTPVTQPKETHR